VPALLHEIQVVTLESGAGFLLVGREKPKLELLLVGQVQLGLRLLFWLS